LNVKLKESLAAIARKTNRCN